MGFKTMELHRSYHKDYIKGWRKRNRAKELESRKRIRRTLKGIYATLRENARRRGLDLDITYEQFLEIRNGSCSYCDGSLSESGTGLDRLDNSKGYLITNVVRCCTRCNLSKHNMNVEEFREWISQVHTTWARRA